MSAQGPLQWDVARQTALMAATEGVTEHNVDPQRRIAVESLANVARMHVAEVTGLATPAAVPLDVVGRATWANLTLQAWKPYFDALAQAIGERTAEEIKKQIGSAQPLPTDRDAEVKGRDLVTGLPKTVVLTAVEIREALDEVVTRMIDSVKECLGETPPELAQDLLTRGIYLVGGGALLRGLPERLQYETKVPVQLSPQPLEAVVLGAGHCIENYQALRGMFMDARR